MGRRTIARVTTPVVQELCRRGIPLSYTSSGGWFYAITHGMSHKNVELRQRQYAAAADPVMCLGLAKRFVQAKIANCRTLLRRNHPAASDELLNAFKGDIRRATQADRLATLLGVEGTAAHRYFTAFAETLHPDEADTGAFDLESRNRRPPRDPVNALLSLAYAMLAREWAVVLFSVGFDPYLGFYHQPRYGKPPLALDLMEEYRPLIADSLVLTVVNTGHELRTPLHSIIGFAEVIRDLAYRKPELSAFVGHANDILEGGVRLLGAIDEMLGLARVDAGRIRLHSREIDPEKLLAACARLAADGAMRRSISILVSVDAGCPTIWADEPALRKVLLNLLSNGIEFTPQGGRISLGAVPASGNGIKLTVADTGIGIPADRLSGDLLHHLRGVMVDVTQGKRAELAQRESEEARRQAAALSSVAALAAAAAHEINNPLAIIQGNLEMFARRPDVAPGVAGRIDAMLAAGRRIAQIVRSMRRITRLQSVPASADLPAMLDLRRCGSSEGP